MAQVTLYVGNLPYDISEEALREFFSTWGPVSEVRIVEGRGFGFVDIPEENIQAAIENTNGQMLQGRILTVNQARPRRERREGGFRSERGGHGGGRRRERRW